MIIMKMDTDIIHSLLAVACQESVASMECFVEFTRLTNYSTNVVNDTNI